MLKNLQYFVNFIAFKFVRGAFWSFLPTNVRIIKLTHTAKFSKNMRKLMESTIKLLISNFHFFQWFGQDRQTSASPSHK